mmetsp:Transcript_15804/g.39749  ORF Transcript_15804/g.39749 Transcript_15804/m.39749 type:complete len:131 (-) Transcript_15804:559-951(-)
MLLRMMLPNNTASAVAVVVAVVVNLTVDVARVVVVTMTVALVVVVAAAVKPAVVLVVVEVGWTTAVPIAFPLLTSTDHVWAAPPRHAHMLTLAEFCESKQMLLRNDTPSKCQIWSSAPLVHGRASMGPPS